MLNVGNEKKYSKLWEQTVLNIFLSIYPQNQQYSFQMIIKQLLMKNHLFGR